MARSTSRMREISTQLAVGASRATLVRQLLTESAALAGLGGACGGLLGYVCIQAFDAMLPYSPVPGGPQFRLDLRVLTCALLASTAAVFLCGLAPALSAVKEAMLTITTNVRAGVAESRAFGALPRRVLIVGQIVLSTVLLMAAGLFLKAFTLAQQADLGFHPDHVLLVMVDPSVRGYSSDKSLQFQQQLLDQTVALPGVRSASLASFVPFVNGASWDISIDGYNAHGGEKFIDTSTNQVGPDYFKTMQIPVLRGREFARHDIKDSPLVAIVNESFARKYIVGNGSLETALGHNIRLRDHDHISIVGVVKDSSRFSIGLPVTPIFYTPYAQMGNPNATLHVRTEGDPAAMTGVIREQLRKLDPEVTPFSVVKLKTVVSSQGLFFARLSAVLVGAFGLVALLLAVVGLYGVVSFMVGRRTQEIGVRMALGAQRTKILSMVLANGISLAMVGLLLGGTLAYLAGSLISGLLVEVSPHDPEVFAVIALVLMMATVGASWIPARRATRVNPMDALRSE